MHFRLWLNCENLLRKRLTSGRVYVFFPFLLLCILTQIQTVKMSPMELPTGDVNVLIVTDVHSWIAGHDKHEPELNADYGHILSFYELLRDMLKKEKKDLFFVMNGDFIDGTGLTTYPPIHLTPLLEHMPWDAVNIGNHELYKNSTIEHITAPGGFVDFWNGTYLTSNTLMKETNEPIGQRYTFLKGKLQKSTILTFGFLYDFENHCEMTEVENVEAVVNSTWFTNVLNRTEGNFDAIMVLAHMDVADPLVEVILAKIRSICGFDMPVQFITGHTHRRDFRLFDAYSTSFEAGRFLDTVGFVSFPIKIEATDDDFLISTQRSSSFQHKFIDARVDSLQNILGVSELNTTAGKNLSALIKETQLSLNLLDVLGCAPMTYHKESALINEDSLWGLYIREVVPENLFEDGIRRLFIQNSGAFRYDLFEGDVTVNDLVSVSPFNDSIYFIGDKISGRDFTSAFGKPNLQSLPELCVAGEVQPNELYEVYSVDFDASFVEKALSEVTGKTFHPSKIGNQTTGMWWAKFVEDQWSCIEVQADEPRHKAGFGGKNWFFGEFAWYKIMGVIFSTMIIICFGWTFIYRNKFRDMENDEDEHSSESSLSASAIRNEKDLLSANRNSVFNTGNVKSEGCYDDGDSLSCEEQSVPSYNSVL